jgi:hypothetical protein
MHEETERRTFGPGQERRLPALRRWRMTRTSKTLRTTVAMIAAAMTVQRLLLRENMLSAPPPFRGRPAPASPESTEVPPCAPPAVRGPGAPALPVAEGAGSFGHGNKALGLLGCASLSARHSCSCTAAGIRADGCLHACACRKVQWRCLECSAPMRRHIRNKASQTPGSSPKQSLVL